MGKTAKKKGNGASRVAAPRKSAWADLKLAAANYTPLSPIVFLPRATEIYPERIAVTDQGKHQPLQWNIGNVHK